MCIRVLIHKMHKPPREIMVAQGKIRPTITQIPTIPEIGDNLSKIFNIRLQGLKMMRCSRKIWKTLTVIGI